MRTFLVVLYVLWSAWPASADWQAGKRAFDRGDYAAARQEWTRLAEQGDVQAQFSLAGMYYQGRGTARNYPEAERWFRRAANAGLAQSQFFLAAMYEEGQGVERT